MEKLLNFAMSLGNDLERLVKFFRTLVILMNAQQCSILEDALCKCIESEDHASRPVDLPNCVTVWQDPAPDSEICFLRKYGGYSFDAEVWFDATRSSFGPDYITREQFLKDILEELFVEDGKTFFTPVAWELFQEQLKKGLDLIDSYIGAKSVSELQRIEQLAIQKAEEEAYWEALEERRANW